MSEHEDKIMDLLVSAHNQYCELTKDDERAQIVDNSDWSHHIRSLQRIIAGRVFKREHPEV